MRKRNVGKTLNVVVSLLLVVTLLGGVAYLTPKTIAGAEGSALVNETIAPKFGENVNGDAATETPNGTPTADGVIIHYNVSQLVDLYEDALAAGNWFAAEDALAKVPAENEELIASFDRYAPGEWLLLDTVYSSLLIEDGATFEQLDTALNNSSVAYIVATRDLEELSAIFIEKNGEQFNLKINSDYGEIEPESESDEITILPEAPDETAAPQPEAPTAEPTAQPEPTEEPQGNENAEFAGVAAPEFNAPEDAPEVVPTEPTEPQTETDAEPTEPAAEPDAPVTEDEPAEDAPPAEETEPTDEPPAEEPAPQTELPPAEDITPDVEFYNPPDDVIFTPDDETGEADDTLIITEPQVYFIPDGASEFAIKVSAPVPTALPDSYNVTVVRTAHYHIGYNNATIDPEPTSYSERGHVWASKNVIPPVGDSNLFTVTLTVGGNVYGSNENPLAAGTDFAITDVLNGYTIEAVTGYTENNTEKTPPSFSGTWTIEHDDFDDTDLIRTLTYTIKPPTTGDFTTADVPSGNASVQFTPAEGNPYYYGGETVVDKHIIFGANINDSGTFVWASVSGVNTFQISNVDIRDTRPQPPNGEGTGWVLSLVGESYTTSNDGVTYKGHTEKDDYNNDRWELWTRADASFTYLEVQYRKKLAPNSPITALIEFTLYTKSDGGLLNYSPIVYKEVIDGSKPTTDDNHPINEDLDNDGTDESVTYTLNQYATTTPQALLLQVVTDNGNPIPEPTAGTSVFKLYDNTYDANNPATGLIDTYIANAFGVIELTAPNGGAPARLLLTPGTYTLVQTTAKDGYEKLATPFEFTITDQLEQVATLVGTPLVNVELTAKVETDDLGNVIKDIAANKLITVTNAACNGQIVIQKTLQIPTGTALNESVHGQATFLFEVKEYRNGDFEQSWVRKITIGENDNNTGTATAITDLRTSSTYTVTELKSARYSAAAAQNVGSAQFITVDGYSGKTAIVQFTNAKSEDSIYYLSSTDVKENQFAVTP